MSTETKRYRLLKDLPYVKAGAIYQFDEGDTYVCDTETAQFTDGTKWDALGALAVENAAEGWFELIPEQSKMPKQERIEVKGIRYHSQGGNMVIDTNCIISEEYFPAIKQAIEQAPNPTTDTNTVSKVKELERLVEYYEAEFNANSDKIYTQQEVDAMIFNYRIKGFKDSRIRKISGIGGLKFFDLDAYKKHLIENKSSTNTGNEVKNKVSEIPLMKQEDYKNSPLSKFYKPKEDAVVKDWEILSYSYHNWIYKKNNLGEFSTSFDAPVYELILHPENMTKIHSVNRLSDGVVFTKMERDGNGFLITGFKVIGNEMEVELDYGSQKKRLSNLTPPIKQSKSDVLFTTSDGVPKYFMDGYWSVSDEFYLYYSNAHPSYINEILAKRTFSTKELAEDYILRYKPVLCLNDISELVNREHSEFVKNSPMYQLMELKAKQKLNNK